LRRFTVASLKFRRSQVVRDFGLSAVAICALSLSGCGGGEVAKPVQATEAAFKGTTDDDKTKVAEHLKKAGIEGEIVGLITGNDKWVVDVAPKVVPGKRASPRPPTAYSVDKKTGAVKRDS
jgi:hypothetical protein